ncbi:MAG: MFS transporter [Proteobacteria bacterium]|nr:MFS transporter [Pseudomonadota bacterium]
MSAAGVLNDIVRSLQVSVALAGQLIGAGAVVMAIASPLLAGLLSGADRRRLLVLALLWTATGQALCALMPDFTALLAVRCLTLLGAAAFTPQAASAIAALAPAASRGEAITFILLGWSVASVLGLPASAWIGEVLGWRWAFAAVALLALGAALAVARALPAGIRPAPMSMADWHGIARQPVLVAVVLVTAFSSAGQFVLFSYFTPYFAQQLGWGANRIGALFLWFGALGVVGNVVLTHVIGRSGAARAVTVSLAGIALSLLAWPAAAGLGSAMLVIAPWALGCFASNSAQQARLALAAPALATALISLNSSAMYAGQFAGAGIGGAIIAAAGFGPLHAAGLASLLAAIGLSLWAGRRMRTAGVSAPP